MSKKELSVPFIAQRHEKFCAFASLAMVSKYYDSEISQDQGAEFLGGWAEQFGVGLSDLKRLAVSKGFRDCDFNRRGRIDDLKSFIDQGHPPIVLHAQCLEDAYPYSRPLHARVVVGYDEECRIIIVHDPQFGDSREITYGDFSALWEESGNTYVLMQRVNP